MIDSEKYQPLPLLGTPTRRLRTKEYGSLETNRVGKKDSYQRSSLSEAKDEEKVISHFLIKYLERK